MVKSQKNDITSILQYPTTAYAASGDWSLIESTIGLKLPEDYKQFIEKYGSGKICDSVSIISPFVQNSDWSLLPYIQITTKSYQSYVDTGVINQLRFPTFPALNGLLPFGTTENSNCLNWLTKGQPISWVLIIWDPDTIEFVASGYRTLADYLIAILKNEHGILPHDALLGTSISAGFTAIDYDNSRFTKAIL